MLSEFADSKKTYTTSQFVREYGRFSRSSSPGVDGAAASQKALEMIESKWVSLDERLKLVPGKAALSEINQKLQDAYWISVTATAIIDAMRIDEIPQEMKDLILLLSEFSAS